MLKPVVLILLGVVIVGINSKHKAKRERTKMCIHLVML